jgi:carbamoyltransferase
MSTKRYYIGLATTMHDPAIAIMDGDGNILFAEASERYYQNKRAIGCTPDNPVYIKQLLKRYCSEGADYTIATSWSKKETKKLLTGNALGLQNMQLGAGVKNRLEKMASQEGAFDTMAWMNRLNLGMQLNAGQSLEYNLRSFMKASSVKIVNYDHHSTHAALACYGSGFDETVCFVVDAGGESGCFGIFKLKEGKIELVDKQKTGENLGGFYTFLTNVCGFDSVKGEEWKVMGLAAYGSYNKELHDLLSSLYHVKGCHLLYSHDKKATREIHKRIKTIAQGSINDFPFKADLAFNGQLVYEEWMTQMINGVHALNISENLVLSGGCGLNSSYNGKITEQTGFMQLYVPSAPADDGNALGAAMLACYNENGFKNKRQKVSAYLGSEISDESLEHFLKFSGLSNAQKLGDEKYAVVAQLLADGKIIGWAQGKAEFGPRSLGNRSILADPRRKEMKDIINERVKFREEFRPFAPSILHEYGPEYFERYEESPYMERTLRFKNEVLEKIPAVVHHNQTGRLQSVKNEWNPGFYQLISEFHKITGIPVLLNTSFNVMGKPIIHSAEDALSVFFTSGLDALVINDYLVKK